MIYMLSGSTGTGMSDIVTAMGTAVGSIADSAMSGIAAILPIGAPIMGAILIIGIGIRTFKKFSGRS